MSAVTRGRSDSTRRAVKARPTSPRSRVWSGGSLSSMCTLSTCGNWLRSPASSRNSARFTGSAKLRGTRSLPTRMSLLRRGSASSALASS
ncbi:hypothetical protein [Streptomyces prasinosporus]|uniref:hypothetical protein n=1 Tax=Streptomyces prasinosporus TaxID=68256 RepID=UPI0031E9584D